MPEWSKGAVSRTAIERCVGSNPTGCIFAKKNKVKVRDMKRVESTKGDINRQGDVAQMVEHSLRMRGARGSIPLISIVF